MQSILSFRENETHIVHWDTIRDKYLDHARELIKNMAPESDGDTNCSRRNIHQRIGTVTGGLKNKRMSGDHKKLQQCWNQPEY